MGRIIVIPNSDFSRNRIVKVNITEQEKSVDNQTLTSTVSVDNPSLKIMINNNGYSKQI